MNRSSNGLLMFFIGVLLLGAGLFLFASNVTVSTSWYNWGFLSFGRGNFANGLISIPLFIGIIWLFFNPKSMVAKVIITLGAIFIILTVIMSIHFNFVRTSLYNYVLMIGMAAAGSGLILRVLFKNRDDKKKGD